MFTMDDLLEIAIKMEKNGQAIYTNAASKLDDRQLKDMLLWMAGEETGHARQFMELKNTLQLDTNEADLKVMVPKVLQDMIGKNTLSLDQIDFAKFTTINDLFQTFIEFEQETIVFYELLEMFIEDPAVLKGLGNIIKEEKKHIKTLESRRNIF
jgi:rubrerythrin